PGERGEENGARTDVSLFVHCRQGDQRLSATAAGGLRREQLQRKRIPGWQVQPQRGTRRRSTGRVAARRNQRRLRTALRPRKALERPQWVRSPGNRRLATQRHRHFAGRLAGFYYRRKQSVGGSAELDRTIGQAR